MPCLPPSVKTVNTNLNYKPQPPIREDNTVHKPAKISDTVVNVDTNRTISSIVSKPHVQSPRTCTDTVTTQMSLNLSDIVEALAQDDHSHYDRYVGLVFGRIYRDKLFRSVL